MANGKIRSEAHIIGEEAVRFLQDNIIPFNWVVRPMNPDYGIDLDVELFDYEDNKCITLGEHVFLQVKGTRSPNYGRFTDGEKEFDVIKFSLEVSELNLVERMGSAFPVLLVVIDLINKKAFHICLNDYIKNVLLAKHSSYKEQGSVTIYIPTRNVLSTENHKALKWYGKRIKLYSMFHEMRADIDDFSSFDIIERIKSGKRFIDHYYSYDVFSQSEHWRLLEDIHSMLIQMRDNDCVSEFAKKFVQHVLGYTDNWENGTVYEGFSEIPINAYQYAQKMSIDRLSETIVNASGMFETYCRERFMPLSIIE